MSRVYKDDDDDLVGEEHKPDSDSVTSLSDREIFDIWCKFFDVRYKNEKEKEYKFDNFQKAVKPPMTEDELDVHYPGLVNHPGLADRTKEELNGVPAYMFPSIIESMKEVIIKREEYIKNSEKLKDSIAEEDNSHSNPKVTSLSDQEIFDIWCKFFDVRYKDEKEKEYKFGNFQKAVKPPITEDELDVHYPGLVNHPGLADRTKEELNGVPAYIFPSIIESMKARNIKQEEYIKNNEKDFVKLKDSVAS